LPAFFQQLASNIDPHFVQKPDVRLSGVQLEIPTKSGNAHISDIRNFFQADVLGIMPQGVLKNFIQTVPVTLLLGFGKTGVGEICYGWPLTQFFQNVKKLK
jgi:hypothetical protein